MRQLLTTIAGILIAGFLHAQDNCFKKCWENYEKSTLPFPENNEQIIQGLVGCKAPNFAVKTITGEALRLDELRGKVVVINFWFKNCAPCVAEMAALNRLREEYKTKEVVFIAFGRDDTSSIADFLKRFEFNYHHVSSDYDLTKEYCLLGGWPTNMVLDKNGIVQQIFTGGQTDEKATTFAYDKMQPIIERCLSR